MRRRVREHFGQAQLFDNDDGLHSVLERVGCKDNLGLREIDPGQSIHDFRLLKKLSQQRPGKVGQDPFSVCFP